MSANTITLNGKVYDSTTGVAVGAKTTHKASKEAQKPSTPKGRVHHQAAHKTAHKAQKARTLMRQSVKKPVITAQESAIEDKPTTHNETVSLFLPQLSENRLKRAQEVQKSKLISRFGNFSNGPSYVQKSAHLPVKAHPAEAISHHDDALLSPEPEAAREDLFASSLHKAVSHKQPNTHHHVAHKKNHRTKLAASVVAIALLGGFFAYQSKPNMEFRVAAARSGVHASLPGYHPSGFAMRGPVEYAPGQLTIHFNSNSDERNFSITQKVSNWNSSALVENYVAKASTDYQTIQDHGRTIYLDNNGNATWVEGGVWYQVEGSSSLTNTQLLKIASSI